MGCYNICMRIPWIALIATIIMCVGVGMFCISGFRAMQIILWGIFEGIFRFQVPWLQSIEIGFFVFGICMGIFAMLLLAFGFLATSATRQNIYSGVACIMGGRISAFFFMVLTYLLNCAWMGVTSVCSLSIILYVMLNSVCTVEVQQRYFQYTDPEWGFCLNLSRFGIYKNYTEGLDLNAICDEQDLDNFCHYIQDSGPMFCVAFAGSFLIVLGLVVYIIDLGANYSRIQASKEMTDYRQAFALDDVSRDNYNVN